MKIFDGGPAFPRPGFYPDTGNVHQEDIRECIATKTEPQDGLTLRDWFAGQALAGFLAMCADPDVSRPTPFDAASLSYRFADAMLKARDPKPPAKADADD